MYGIKIEPNTNLLEETLFSLNFYSKTPDDILFVTDGTNYYSFKQFAKEAENISYFNGHYKTEINPILKLVGKDFWFEREIYDGLEDWSYKTTPKKENYTYSDEIIIKVEE